MISSGQGQTKPVPQQIFQATSQVTYIGMIDEETQIKLSHDLEKNKSTDFSSPRSQFQ